MLYRRLSAGLALFALLWLLVPSPAHAYLDPGAGSYLFQILLASAVAAGFLVKVFWGKIRAFFTRLHRALGGGRRRDKAGDGA